MNKIKKHGIKEDDPKQTNSDTPPPKLPDPDPSPIYIDRDLCFDLTTEQ
ncbi:MAG: hypothetical protein IPP37_12940 [Saprospiraceae bacterium]|nr:hypothetical protein [Saprospiraceae bacterium]